MTAVALIVAPVFALIALGYAAGRLGWVSDAARTGLAEFTFTLAIPAMLFRKMATAEMPDAAPLAIWAAYFGAVAATWLLATAATSGFLRRPAQDGASIAMSAGFGNVVMLGIPLSINVYGEASAAPIALIVSLHSPLLWTLAALHLAWARRDGSAPISEVGRDLGRELSRNVIIMAIVAGTLWRFTGFGLDPLADEIISLLGRAGIPCALVALGLSLVGFRIAGQMPTLSAILVLKLVVTPLVAWLLATKVFALPPAAAGVVVIFAAMPTGANAYLFASRVGLAQHSASGAVALGTVLSAASAALVVYMLG